MKNQIMSFLSLLTTLISFNLQAQINCTPASVSNNFTDAVKGVENQITILNKVLNGEELGSFAVSDLFGYDYNINNSADHLKMLKAQIVKEGVAPEHMSLKHCLGKLNQIEDLAKLKSISNERHRLRVLLFERNKNSHGDLKQNLEEQSTIPTLKKELTEAKKSSELEKQELEKDLIESETKFLSEKKHEVYSQEVLGFKKVLTKIKLDLINKRLEYNSNLEQKLIYFEEKTRSLAIISSRKNRSETELRESFDSIEKLWLEISNENLGQLLKTEIIYEFSRVPEFPVKLLSVKDEQKKEILSSMDVLRQLRKKTIEELADKKEKEFRLLNELVFQTNSLRSRLFERLKLGYFLKRVSSKNGLKAIKNEVTTSPYRLLSFGYSKYYYVRDKLYGKKEGIKVLIRDAFAIFFFFAGLFFLNLLFERFIAWVNARQNPFVRKYYNSGIVKSASNFWNKIKDNAKNILWLITLMFLEDVAALKDYGLIISLVKVIISVKILKSLVILFLSFISAIDYKNFNSFKQKAQTTADKFGKIFLVYNLFLILVQATIGEVYLYTLIKTFIVIYTIWQVVLTTVAWESEFKMYIERRFSGLIVQKLNSFSSFLPSYFRTICTFFAIIILSVFDFIVKVTENFEISKKISANLFKKQIENVEALEGAGEKIPNDYRNLFHFRSLEGSTEKQYVQFDEKLEQKVTCEIAEWLDGKSDEQSLVLFGDKGVGKTTFLKHLGAKVVENHKALSVIYTQMPSKVLDKKTLQTFLHKTLDTCYVADEASDISDSDFEAKEKEQGPRTIVVIDEAQNLFLSQTGGFEAYYHFTEVVNDSSQNVFWIMSFNKYSWLYLDRAFGRTQFFRNVFELKGWNDGNIKELIMKRHLTSDFKLSYDLLISATRSQDEMDKYASIEAKFFKLLWELSRGNPRAALALWLSALSMKNKTILNVNIPKEPEIEGIDKLPDDLLFILAHVLKHENLSIGELEVSTGLPRGIVRNAVRQSMERGYLYKDSKHRYMIDINLQHSLIKYLRVKNFVYGN